MSTVPDAETVFEPLIQRLQLEHRRTTDEVAAFETFIERVQRIPVKPTVCDSRPQTVINRRTAGGVEALREAYQSTIMDVPHYDEVYGNACLEDVTEEFGSIIATAVFQEGPFDEGAKNAVIKAATTARAERTDFIDVISAERESVQTVAAQIESVAEELTELSDRSFTEETFGALVGYHNRMTTISKRCDAIAEQRQTHLREYQTTIPRCDAIAALPRYFYADLDATFPVLSYIARLGEQIEATRRDILRAASHYSCR